jgi:hypothetical protein
MGGDDVNGIRQSHNRVRDRTLQTRHKTLGPHREGGGSWQSDYLRLKKEFDLWRAL